ncbi:hypothetical protein [Streptomyces cavernae]|uniref:hypothetical protein n=1 Tax=Streptomyces cavernae TaxID=2259034 RepID=UPI001EE42730|nr:hypothetical protein [Streptomyces cavernae]
MQAQGVGDGERDERGVAQSGQVDEAHSVGEGPFDAGGDTTRQTRLADAARSGQGDQACVAQQFVALGQFVPPVDEGGRLRRQVAVPSRR